MKRHKSVIETNKEEDSDVAVKAPKNNPVHLNCIRNVEFKNYYPQNNINTNTNIVALQIPVKYLSMMKLKKENTLEMKNKS